MATVGPLDSLLFLDFDGVCTSAKDGGYVSNPPSLYGPSPDILERIRWICRETGAKVVISSNWRRFPNDGEWPFCGKIYVNPLPKLRECLGDLTVGTLPLDRHITKSEALTLWFEDNQDFQGRYAIVDDDVGEGFQDVPSFLRHFWLTDTSLGITDEVAADIVRHLKDDSVWERR